MRALISVSDKTGVIEFAQQLEKLGVKVISTGGTATTLANNGVNVIGWRHADGTGPDGVRRADDEMA